MKWLVGAACVTVVAAGAVYLNGEYRSHMAEVDFANNAPTRRCVEVLNDLAYFKKTGKLALTYTGKASEEMRNCQKLLYGI